MFKDHFSTGSEDYAAFRPVYPFKLVDELAKVSPGRRLALDCGCGTGQLSTLLAERFEAVVATDASAAQIDKAEPHKRVTYRVALAEDSGLADGSVDLVTVAQAAHWLNLERFYEEVRRVAAPGGAVALIAYGMLSVDAEVDAVVGRFYEETVGPYWPPERRLVEEGYQSLPFPFAEVELPGLQMEAFWTLSGLLGYLRTWSASKAAQRALGFDPVSRVEAELRPAWDDSESQRRVVWPLSIRAGHVQQD